MCEQLPHLARGQQQIKLLSTTYAWGFMQACSTGWTPNLLWDEEITARNIEADLCAGLLLAMHMLTK